MDKVLEVDGLRKEYHQGPRRVLAVDRVSLTVHAGEIVGLLGPNGAGKTTVIKCICGLVTGDTGRVQILGVSPFGSTAPEARRHLGAVLEGARNIYWQLSVRENLHYFGGMRGAPKTALTARVAELLDRLNLWAVADQPVKVLSRGTQQRAATAVALVHNPALALLDEPTLGLDLASTEAILREIGDMAAVTGKAVLLTTHQLELAERLCHRIAIIHRGRLLTFTPRGELLRRFERERAAELSLDGPLPTALAEPLQRSYPGLRVQDGPEGARLALPPGSGRPPEQLFLDLWQAGCTVRHFNRQDSLAEVYRRLIAAWDAEEIGDEASAHVADDQS